MSTIKVTGDALPWLLRADADMRSGTRVRKSMAVEAAKTVREHFRALDRTRHRGFGTSNFYGDAAGSTTHEVTADDIYVVVGGKGSFKGGAIAQRYFGGTIRPKKAKSLTIPVKGSAAERTGRRASEFDDIFMVKRDGSGEYKGFLARMVGEEMEPLFWLRSSITQEPDPSVLPTAEELGKAMGKAADRTIRRMKQS